MIVRGSVFETLGGTSCCLRGNLGAERFGLQVPCDCAFMWHFNYCGRYLLITPFSPTALHVLTLATCRLLQRWKQSRLLPFFCSVNKCNCLLLCVCPGDLASYFNANSFALCINDGLNAISKTCEGTVGSLLETNESGSFLLFYYLFRMFFVLLLHFCPHQIINLTVKMWRE